MATESKVKNNKTKEQNLYKHKKKVVCEEIWLRIFFFLELKGCVWTTLQKLKINS